MTNDQLIDRLEAKLEIAEETIRDKLGLEWCERCEYYRETTTEVRSGKRGHPDYWEPDEVITRCADCGRAQE